MPCPSPIRVVHGDLSSMVRCGRCDYCRIRRKQSWVGRLALEYQDHPASRFLTLTYQDAPEVLPVSDLQGFMKRYRYFYGPCRFFAIGEYGEKSGRGHWHLIVFGHAPVVQGHWKDNLAWKDGFSYDGTVTLASIGYVAGYTLKYSDPSRPVITRMSLRPGIGFSRLEKLGSLMAQSYQLTAAPSWPSGFRWTKRRYPLCDGGMIAFQRGYLDSGGLPPVSQTPEERHLIALASLGDLGTRIEGQRAYNRFHMMRRGFDGLEKKARTKV